MTNSIHLENLEPYTDNRAHRMPSERNTGIPNQLKLDKEEYETTKNHIDKWTLRQKEEQNQGSQEGEQETNNMQNSNAGNNIQNNNAPNNNMNNNQQQNNGGDILSSAEIYRFFNVNVIFDLDLDLVSNVFLRK